MKKFLTRIPLQGCGNLQKMKYTAVDHEKLQMDNEVSFPILTAVNGYVQENEELEILAVVADSEAEENNYQELCRQAEEICKYLKPDGLFHHDDWGSQTSTFMSPEMF